MIPVSSVLIERFPSAFVSQVTKKEVLKRRDTGDDGLRSEYLVQKIVIPINVPTPKKGGIPVTEDDEAVFSRIIASRVMRS